MGGRVGGGVGVGVAVGGGGTAVGGGGGGGQYGSHDGGSVGPGPQLHSAGQESVQ